MCSFTTLPSAIYCANLFAVQAITPGACSGNGRYYYLQTPRKTFAAGEMDELRNPPRQYGVHQRVFRRF